jgi:splicing factor U2AF subunit
MSGELQLQNVGGAASSSTTTGVAAAAPISSPTAVVANQLQPTTVVELKQMLTLQDLTDDAEYDDILEDTREECSSFGTLKNIIIPRSGPGATKVFLEYLTCDDAGRAIAGLAGRTFDGRKVEAVYFDPVKFANQDYSD